MYHDLIPSSSLVVPQQVGRVTIPALFTDAGEPAAKRVIEFFTASIRNPNTRTAYARAVFRFADWCSARKLRLHKLTPVHVGTYIEHLGKRKEERGEGLAKPTVKQHLAAIRMLFDHLVTGQIVPLNPAASVRGPKYVLKRGKSPVLTAQEARQLLDRIDHRKDEQGRSVLIEDKDLPIVALRDRALIAAMVYSFARIGAVVGMNVEDYCQRGKRSWLRLHEKGGKHHEVPAHHNAEHYLDAYVHAAGIAGQKGSPLFRTVDRRGKLTAHRLDRREALAMVKRRAQAAGFGDGICCHSFRATGITVYLESGGTIEKAQAIACHESPRTTKLYDHTSDQLTLDEIEKIQI